MTSDSRDTESLRDSDERPGGELTGEDAFVNRDAMVDGVAHETVDLPRIQGSGIATFAEPAALTEAINTAAIAILSKNNRNERAVWIVGVLFLIGGIGALTYFLIMASNTADSWQTRSDELSEINYDLGANIADLQAEVATVQADNQVYTDQNNELRDRILELSDEKQQALDTNAGTSQLVEALDSLVGQGIFASSSLARCIQEQESLAQIVASPDEFEPEDIEELTAGVADLCDAAVRAYNDFQAAVSE